MTQPVTYTNQSQAIEPHEGMRYFDLSKHTAAEAELLYQELAPFVSAPFLMPNGRFLGWVAGGDRPQFHDGVYAEE